VKPWPLLAFALAACGGAAPPEVMDVQVGAEHATAFTFGGGTALTAAHVVRGREAVTVGRRRARVLRVDRRLDVAVLAVPGLRGSAPRRAAARAGERITVRVPRATLQGTVRRLIVAHVSGQTRPALELDAAIEPGDSGAPVLDGRGRLLGVVFAEASDRANLAYAVDARALPTRR
jgi:putative serine protease PepD